MRELIQSIDKFAPDANLKLILNNAELKDDQALAKIIESQYDNHCLQYGRTMLRMSSLKILVIYAQAILEKIALKEALKKITDLQTENINEVKPSVAYFNLEIDSAIHSFEQICKKATDMLQSKVNNQMVTTVTQINSTLFHHSTIQPNNSELVASKPSMSG